MKLKLIVQYGNAFRWNNCFDNTTKSGGIPGFGGVTPSAVSPHSVMASGHMLWHIIASIKAVATKISVPHF